MVRDLVLREEIAGLPARIEKMNVQFPQPLFFVGNGIFGKDGNVFPYGSGIGGGRIVRAIARHKRRVLSDSFFNGRQVDVDEAMLELLLRQRHRLFSLSQDRLIDRQFPAQRSIFRPGRPDLNVDGKIDS